MHRIDADAHVGNLFDEGDPLVPRQPTQIDFHWLNAVQEELVNAITAASVALVKGTNNQLAGVIVDRMRAQAISGVKTFNDNLIALANLNVGAVLTVTGAANLAAGAAITQSVSNTNAINATGNGTGVGAVLTGGASGGGVNAYGNGLGTAGRFENLGTGYGVHAIADTTSPNRSALRLEPQNADPSSASMGDLYVNSTNGKLMLFDGSVWVVAGTQT